MVAIAFAVASAAWLEDQERRRDESRREGRNGQPDQRQDVESPGESLELRASGDVGKQSEADEAADGGEHKLGRALPGGSHDLDEDIARDLSSIAAALVEGNRMAKAGSRPLIAYYAAAIVGTLFLSVSTAFLIWNYQLSQRSTRYAARQAASAELVLILDHRPMMELGRGRIVRDAHGLTLFSGVQNVGKGDARVVHLGDLKFAATRGQLVRQCPATPPRFDPGARRGGMMIRVGRTVDLHSELPMVSKVPGAPAYIFGTLGYASDAEGVMHCQDFAYPISEDRDGPTAADGTDDLEPDGRFSSSDEGVLPGFLAPRLCGSGPVHGCEQDVDPAPTPPELVRWILTLFGFDH